MAIPNSGAYAPLWDYLYATLDDINFMLGVDRKQTLHQMTPKV